MTADPTTTAMLAADPGQAMGWLIGALILFIRDYGWMVALGGFAVVWLVRKTVNHAGIALLMVIVSMVSSLLLPASIVLHFVTFANMAQKKAQPPIELRRAQ